MVEYRWRRQMVEYRAPTGCSCRYENIPDTPFEGLTTCKWYVCEACKEYDRWMREGIYLRLAGADDA